MAVSYTHLDVYKRQRSKNDKKKKLLKKVILFIIIVAIIILAISLGVSAYSWKVLSEDMFVNEHSTVIDKEGNVIAELGNEQKKIKTDISEIDVYKRQSLCCI